jgi:tRNA (cmo5U34)-methyltransferase
MDFSGNPAQENPFRKRALLNLETTGDDQMSESDNTTPHRASDYDQVIRQTMPFYDVILSESIDLVKSARPDVTCWLDTGCGTGTMVEAALPHFPKTGFILADPSEAMLREAGKRFEATPSVRLKFLPAMGSGDLAAYGLDVRPEVITAILCHHYLGTSGRNSAISSCHEVLANGGILVLFENIDFGLPEVNEAALARWGRYQAEQGKSQAAISSHLKRFKTGYFPITIDEHIKLLRDTGFSKVAMFWLSHMQAGFYAIK